MNTINVSNPSSNLTNNKYTNEIKSSFLVADILDKKTINNNSKSDDEDEKIEIEDDLDIKTIKSNDNAINLSASTIKDHDKSPNRSPSVELNHLNQINHLNHLNHLQLSQQLNQLNQLNPLIQHTGEHNESLIDSIYSRLLDPKHLNQNLLANLNQQTKNELNKKQNLLHQHPLTNSISNLIKTNSLNENQLTNATGKFNFSSLFNTHPHLFAQSLEAMVGNGNSDLSSFSNVQNLAKITAQNFQHHSLNYPPVPTNLLPSTSKLTNTSPLPNTTVLEQLRNNQQHLNQLNQLKDFKNKQFQLPNQPNAIDLIKQFQNKIQNQFTDDTKFNKNALNFPSNPLLFNSALHQAYNRNSIEQDPETLNKLCSNFNLQQIIYQQHLQNQLEKHAFPYPIPQNGNLGLLNNNSNEQEIQNSQNYLLNSFLANQDNKHVNNTTNHNQNDEEDETNGISRTNSPASSSHSSAIVQFNNNENSVQMTTFHPSMDYTWVVHSKQLQRKRTVFNLYQRTQLEETFLKKKYISKSDRVLLAKKIGLNDSQIKVWFINRRTKYRNVVEQQKLKKREN